MKFWPLHMLSATLIACIVLPIAPAWANGVPVRHIPPTPNQQRHMSVVQGAVQSVSQDARGAETDQSVHRWDIRSSVQVSRDALRDAYIASREAYTKKLKKYATCSERDAQKAVTSEHPGMKIEDIQLRNIRTSLVYMAVVADDEEKFLVVVDAGNGKILMDKPMPTHHEKVFAEH